MNELLQKLLDKDTLPINGNKYYLSAYIPFDDSKRTNFNTHIRSSLFKALRKHKELSNSTQLHENIIKAVSEIVTPFLYLEKGVGIFIKFDAIDQNKQRTKSDLKENINVITFSRKPEKEVFIGYIYNLYQLIWLTKNSVEALVVRLSREDSTVYEVDGTQINELKTFTNEHIPEEKHYSRIYAPVRGKIGNIHGTGKSKVKKAEVDSSKEFLKEIEDYVYSKKISSYEYLVVIYSESFTEFIDEGFNRKGDHTVIFINKNLQDPKVILKTTKDEIKRVQKSTKKDEITVAKEGYPLYCEGWTESINAIEAGQVEKLFIKTGITREGYIDPESKRVTTYQKKDSIKIENIIPWIIKLTKDKGGSIVVFNTSSYENVPEIAAQLRFKK